jgi:hypothetical protein
MTSACSLHNFINIPYLESHVLLAAWCAPWKFTIGVANLVLQTLQFQKVGIYCKFPLGQA